MYTRIYLYIYLFTYVYVYIVSLYPSCDFYCIHLCQRMPKSKLAIYSTTFSQKQWTWLPCRQRRSPQTRIGASCCLMSFRSGSSKKGSDGTPHDRPSSVTVGTQHQLHHWVIEGFQHFSVNMCVNPCLLNPIQRANPPKNSEKLLTIRNFYIE